MKRIKSLGTGALAAAGLLLVSPPTFSADAVGTAAGVDAAVKAKAEVAKPAEAKPADAKPVSDKGAAEAKSTTIAHHRHHRHHKHTMTSTDAKASSAVEAKPPAGNAATDTKAATGLAK